MKVAALLLLLAACGRRAAVETCADDLSGAYDGNSGRWMVIDNGKALEVYPLFDDTHPPATGSASEIAPRVIDLTRTPVGADGEAKRRFMHGANACIATAPAHLVACSGDGLEVVLGDPPPCPPQGSAPTHRERWRRE